MPRGGQRPGAGRKTGWGPYGEPTQVMRIPRSHVEDVSAWLRRLRVASGDTPEFLGVAGAFRPLCLPLFASRVPAGFPSPAEGYVERQLDLNDYLVCHESATFYLRVKGHSMTGAGILEGDIIAVDRALEPRDGDIVLAVVDGEFTVKTLARAGERIRLLPQHPDFSPIECRDGRELAIWGVVSGVVRKLR